MTLWMNVQNPVDREAKGTRLQSASTDPKDALTDLSTETAPYTSHHP